MVDGDGRKTARESVRIGQRCGFEKCQSVSESRPQRLRRGGVFLEGVQIGAQNRSQKPRRKRNTEEIPKQSTHQSGPKVTDR